MINYDINLNENSFKEAVNEILLKNEIDEIIETGTFNGLGSTTIFAKTGKKIISIESCLGNYYMAQDNLKNYSNVELLYGSSLKIEEMINFIKNDKIYSSSEVLDGKIIIDGFTEKDAKEGYESEILGWGYPTPKAEDLLINLINNNKKQIVFLDSAGGVGYMEFKKFMSIKKEFLIKKVLMLDDISHVKHFRSVKDLISLGYDVKISNNKRFAYHSFINDTI
jgi:hypothetical protein